VFIHYGDVMPVTKQPAPPRIRAEKRPPFDPARRFEILQAALSVFAEKGFHRSTIRDIAKAAQIAEGTIYNHFENKTALMLALFEGIDAQGQRQASLDITADQTLAEFLPAHFQQMLNLLVEPTGKALPVILAELLTNASLRNEYAQKILQPMFGTGEQAMNLWAQQGRIRSKHPALTVRLIGALLLGTVVQRLLGDDLLVKQWDKVPAALADLLLTGIENPTTPVAAKKEPR
jgi:AcrR family transcriptional regulator